MTTRPDPNGEWGQFVSWARFNAATAALVAQLATGDPNAGATYLQEAVASVAQLPSVVNANRARFAMPPLATTDDDVRANLLLTAQVELAQRIGERAAQDEADRVTAIVAAAREREILYQQEQAARAVEVARQAAVRAEAEATAAERTVIAVNNPALSAAEVEQALGYEKLGISRPGESLAELLVRQGTAEAGTVAAVARAADEKAAATAQQLYDAGAADRAKEAQRFADIEAETARATAEIRAREAVDVAARIAAVRQQADDFNAGELAAGRDALPAKLAAFAAAEGARNPSMARLIKANVQVQSPTVTGQGLLVDDPSQVRAWKAYNKAMADNYEQLAPKVAGAHVPLWEILAALLLFI